MPTHCPTCGAELASRSICAHCGTLAGAEVALSRLKTRTALAIRSRLPKFGPVGPYHFLWACSVMPVVLLPPIVSLGTAVVALRRQRFEQAPALSFEWIAIVSALNILLSLLLLYKFHFSPIELIEFATQIVGDAIRSVFRVLPIPHPGPKLIPV